MTSEWNKYHNQQKAIRAITEKDKGLIAWARRTSIDMEAKAAREKRK